VTEYQKSHILFQSAFLSLIIGNKPYQYKRPAIVRFIGDEEHTKVYSEHGLRLNKYYLAYFVEYWETERDNIHIKNDTCKIEYWYELKDFKIIEDNISF